ncbi:MAG: phosphatidylserine decarboxylase [Firmicutes bacterium]|nr:phosphatidylserine decarboxylase [Bacillota bacterium]
MTDIIPLVLYRTVPGRCLLKALASPGLSRIAGTFLSLDLSRRIVPWYIRKYGIRMSDIEVPAGGFTSFNEFFTRKRKDGMRPKPEAGQVLCPCDGLLSVVKIREDSCFRLKGMPYSLRRLLDDEGLAAFLQGGLAMIFRLTPQHYHRYCYSMNGNVMHSRRIEGKLHCVRPVALETVPVFAENSREYQVIRTPQGRYMVHMEIGALLVGRISNYPGQDSGAAVCAGEEKGYFEFGGSTIVLIFEKDMIHLNHELFDKHERTGEIPVHMGQMLGRILK